jgi:hypothetical protein
MECLSDKNPPHNDGETMLFACMSCEGVDYVSVGGSVGLVVRYGERGFYPTENQSARVPESQKMETWEQRATPFRAAIQRPRLLLNALLMMEPIVMRLVARFLVEL